MQTRLPLLALLAGCAPGDFFGPSLSEQAAAPCTVAIEAGPPAGRDPAVAALFPRLLLTLPCAR